MNTTIKKLLNITYGASLITAIVGITAFPALSQVEKDFGFDEAFPELHAYYSTRYSDFDKGATTNTHKSSFDPYQLYLNISSHLRNNLKAEAELEFEHGSQEIKINKLLASWSLMKRLKLDMGAKNTPFSIGERVYYNPKNLKKSIFQPYVLRLVAPINWVGTGIHILGYLGKEKENMHLHYYASVINGLGESVATDIRGARLIQDNNNNKFVIGKLEFLPLKTVEIGVSYTTGKYDDKNSLTTSISGAHLIVDKGPFNLVGEYLLRQTETDTVTQKHSGYYVDLGFKLLEKKKLKHLKYIEPVVRFEEIYHENTNIYTDLRRITAGLVIVPYDHFKFRLGYHIVTELEGPLINNDGFGAQVIIDF